MKTFFVMIICLFSTVSFANMNRLEIGCISGIRACIPSSGNTCKYVWMYEQIGGAYSVALLKIGNGPTYEIWTGETNGIQNGIPFHLTVSQKRSSANFLNFLTLEATFGNSTVSSSGQELAQVSIVNNQNQKGTTVRCEVVVPIDP